MKQSLTYRTFLLFFHCCWYKIHVYTNCELLCIIISLNISVYCISYAILVSEHLAFMVQIYACNLTTAFRNREINIFYPRLSTLWEQTRNTWKKSFVGKLLETSIMARHKIDFLCTDTHTISIWNNSNNLNSTFQWILSSLFLCLHALTCS